MTTYSKPARAHTPSSMKSLSGYTKPGSAQFCLSSPNFQAESIFSNFTSMLENANLSTAQILSLACKLNSAYDSIRNSLPSFSALSFTTDLLRFMSLSRNLSDISWFTPIDIINWVDVTSSLVMRIWDLFSQESPSSIASRTYRALKSQTYEWKMRISTFFHAESGLNAIEAISAIAALDAMLPKRLKGLLAAAPLYTRTKILDDSDAFQHVMSWIVDLPIAIARKLGAPDAVVSKLQSVFNMIPGSRVCLYKRRIFSLISERENKPSVICDKEYQDSVISLMKEISLWKTESLLSHSVLPYGFADIYRQGLELEKKIHYMKNSTRVEPVFMVLGGLAGTGKTVIMGGLSQAFEGENTVYVHSPMERDYYDNYDFEDIMTIDDLGQKGLSQWGNMINFVSSCQCTLDCAQADRKDTKRFVSRLILATSNTCKQLNITPTSPIADLGALYRRIHYVDFDQVVFSGGVYTGKMSIQVYTGTPRGHSWQVVQSLDLSGKTESDILTWLHSYLVVELDKRARNYTTNTSSTLKFPSIKAETAGLCPGVFESLLSLFDTDCKVGCWTAGVGILALVFCVSYFSRSSNTKPAWAPISTSGPRFNLTGPKGATVKGYWSDNRKPSSMANWQAEIDSVIPDSTQCEGNPTLRSLRDKSCVIASNDKDHPFTACAVVSGRVIVTVSHIRPNIAIGDSFFLKVYASNKQVVYDGIEVTVSFLDKSDDLLILTMKPETQVFFRKAPIVKESTNTNGYLVSASGIYPTGKLTLSGLRMGYSHLNGYKNFISKSDFVYDVRGDGLCGSWLVNEDGFLLGHHIAGDVALGKGAAKYFSKTNREAILGFINHGFYSSQQLHDRKIDSSLGPSVVELNDKVSVSVNSQSTIVPSLVYGIHPVERSPANLTLHGSNTTLKMASAAFKETMPVHMFALLWAASYLRSVIPTFSPLTDFETLNGKGSLGKIRLDTSAGIGYPGLKQDYVHVKDGVLSLCARLTGDISTLKNSILSNTYKNAYPNKACLKPELRNNEKVDKPRVFSAVPFSHLLVERQLFGDLTNHLHSQPFDTGVMVGINPFSADWSDLAKYITRYGDFVWDGDVANWDKNMLSTFQRTLHEILVDKLDSTDNNKRIASQILEDFVSSLYHCKNVAYMTTHSLPSGRFLTADYNSLIHKMLNLYIYCVLYHEKFNRMPQFHEYDLNVSFAAYGDDSLNGASSRIRDWFNAKTMQKVFVDLGMDFTPADKGEWKNAGHSIMQCSFLKRSFALHWNTGKMVAPLEERSMRSTLNFVKDDFRNEELTYIKLLNFQREAYLHPHYRDLMAHIKLHLSTRQMRPPVFHDEQTLQSLYESGAYFDLYSCS